MKKRYIFMPYSIAEIGGAELYMMNKLKWLEQHGWETHVLSACVYEGKYKIEYLDKYRFENIQILNYAPFACSKKIVNKTIEKMLSLVNGTEVYEETIIESHEGSTALWGELLAEKIKAKHVIDLINETFNEVSYKQQIDFFLFKYDRGELFGGPHAFGLLFEGIRVFSRDELNWFELQEDPVQDVENYKIDAIKKYDYTICYIGRAAKNYFPNIIKGVSSFARKYSEKSIQFVIVGDTTKCSELINTAFNGIKNLKIVLLGDVFPLPKKLFSVVDVVVASSGSALASAYEGVPTIVADIDNNMANGILGYDTDQAIKHDPNVKQTDFDIALKNVLIDRCYLSKEFILKPKRSIDECCKQNFELISKSSKTVEYYDSRIICSGKILSMEGIKAKIVYYFPSVVPKLIKIKKKLIEKNNVRGVKNKNE